MQTSGSTVSTGTPPYERYVKATANVAQRTTNALAASPPMANSTIARMTPMTGCRSCQSSRGR